MRFGIGYDVHKLVEGRALIIGGVRIDYPKGLDGHSDADVLVHSIMDALLGAAALKDIGHHFPDTDEKYKGINSMSLLSAVKQKIIEEGYGINNLDATIICQKPKLSPFIPQMTKNIAKCLEINDNYVNVKATTTEGLGFIGKGEGIAAMSVASIVALDKKPHELLNK